MTVHGTLPVPRLSALGSLITLHPSHLPHPHLSSLSGYWSFNLTYDPVSIDFSNWECTDIDLGVVDMSNTAVLKILLSFILVPTAGT